jgi:iron complex outermembrane receptor protein
LGVRASRGHELEVVSGDVFVPAVRTDQLYTAFVQDEIPIVPNRLSLFAGTKLLVTNYAGVDPEPSFRMLWTPTATETVWASFTHAVRTPSDAERDFYLSSFLGNGVAASNSLPTFARFNANPDFQSETLDGTELGYRHLFRPNVYVDVAAFYNRYQHLLSQELTGPFTVTSGVPFPDPNPPFSYNLIPAQFRNGLRGNTKGVEVAPEWQVLPFWRLRGSYSFLHMNLAKEPGSGDLGTAPGIQGSSPQHQATLQSYFDLPKSVSFDFEYRFVSALQSQSVPAYSTANVHVSWRFNRNVELSVVGDNLFQGGHAEFAGDPGPLVLIRRSAYGKVTFTK